jgi:hypothetical protein
MEVVNNIPKTVSEGQLITSRKRGSIYVPIERKGLMMLMMKGRRGCPRRRVVPLHLIRRCS